MKREDITHLAQLSRMTVTDEELDALATELPKIVSYVSAISDIAAIEGDETPVIGPVHNVFREDVITNEADGHTVDLLREMPVTEGRYMKVKKILKTNTD